MTVIKAAAVQLSPVLYSREGTVEKVIQTILDLGSKGVQFATFPETVGQRTREFGIKMVLGADRATIFRSVTSQAFRSTAFGLLCGVALTAPAMWTLDRFFASALPLHGLNTFIFGVSALLLAAVSL